MPRPPAAFLTDHNKMCAAAAQRFGFNVVGLVDHHKDEELHLVAATRVLDASANSACTLGQPPRARARAPHPPP